MNIVQTNTYNHARVLDMIELVCVGHVRMRRRDRIYVVVALWRVFDTTWGRAMDPFCVVTIYIYLTIGARFAIWTLRYGLLYNSDTQCKPGATGQ